MKKMKGSFSVFPILLIIGILTGCNTDKDVNPAAKPEENPSSEQNFATAKATLEIIGEIQGLNDLAMAISMEGESAPQASGRIAAIKETQCGTIDFQVNEDTGFGTITVDYGNGQNCIDGEQRKGKIIFTTVASTGANAIVMNAQFVGYEANAKKLDGNYSVGISFNERDNSITYTYNFKDAVLTYQDGSKVSWKSNYIMVFKMESGEVESDLPMMSFNITGGLSGTDRKGKAFSAQITTPLLVDAACRYGITTGKYLLTAEGYSSAIYDFGNGECDNKATLTIDKKSELIIIEE